MKSVLRKTVLCLALSIPAFGVLPSFAADLTSADVKPAAPRTYVDTLDMRSPQAAADTFLKAFARADYFAVFKVLSPQAQLGFSELIQTGETGQLLPLMEGKTLSGSVYYEARANPGRSEVAEDHALMFDDIMMAAQRSDILPLTIGPGARRGKVAINGDTATVAVSNDGKPAELTLQLDLQPSGRWKVGRIVWPGSTDDIRPWTASKLDRPAAASKPAAARPMSAGPRIYPETLDMKTPAATATGFLKAYARSDYFEVHQFLSPGARDGFTAGVFGSGDVKLIPRMKDHELPGAALFAEGDAGIEVINDNSLSFDDVLMAAQRNDMLPFTLGAGARLGPVQTQGKTARAAIVTDGKPAALAMELRLLESGRWKVEQLTWEGSSASAKPWGAPQQN